MTALRTRAVVPTTSASRYLQQLCKHWSHKAPVEFDPHTGRIELGFGVTELVAGPEALTITIAHAGDGDPERAQMVVAKHLDRFAFREGELVYDWHELVAE